MRIRTRESEEKRREKWMQRNQGYLDKREERKDSVPPLRTDSFRRVGQTRSRSVSRARSNKPNADVPKPPPAPARASVTPPQGPSATPKPVRYKAAPVSLKQAPTPASTSTVQPPVKAPPVPPPGRSSGSTRLPSHVKYWSGWWFGTFGLCFHSVGNNHPNWLILFRGIETTNQMSLGNKKLRDWLWNLSKIIVTSLWLHWNRC